MLKGRSYDGYLTTLDDIRALFPLMTFLSLSSTTSLSRLCPPLPLDPINIDCCPALLPRPTSNLGRVCSIPFSLIATTYRLFSLHNLSLIDTFNRLFPPVFLNPIRIVRRNVYCT